MAVLTAIALAAAIGTTVYSFVEADKQRKLQADAERDAEKYMNEARKKLDINYYKALSIKKEPYELERQALAAAGAQSVEAAKEGEIRGIGGTAGRVQMAQNEAQAGIRTAMGKEQSALDAIIQRENSRLRDVNVQLDLEEVAGAQLAQANAWELSQQYKQQGLQGVADVTKQVAAIAPLYSNLSYKRENKPNVKLLAEEFDKTPMAKNGLTLQDWIGSQSDISPQFAGVGEMDNKSLMNYLVGLEPSYVQNLLSQLRQW